MYKGLKNLKYTQNFLKNSNLVGSLLSKTDIKAGDTVLDIGSGMGIITDELLKVGARPVAIELDPRLQDLLEDRYGERVPMYKGDFLDFQFPRFPYKAFSNIPFNITNAIVKKLFLSNERGPESAYLIMERIAAEKFVGQPYGKSTAVGAKISLGYEISILAQMKPQDYEPKSNAETVLVSFEKKEGSQGRGKYLLIDYLFNKGRKNILKTLSKKYNYQKIKTLLKSLKINPEKCASELTNDQIVTIVNNLV